jgi:hypothetical protein
VDVLFGLQLEPTTATGRRGLDSAASTPKQVTGRFPGPPRSELSSNLLPCKHFPQVSIPEVLVDHIGRCAARHAL